jgi:hypothetical protein
MGGRAAEGKGEAPRKNTQVSLDRERSYLAFSAPRSSPPPPCVELFSPFFSNLFVQYSVNDGGECPVELPV